jgi:inosose dehydratase
MTTRREFLASALAAPVLTAEPGDKPRLIAQVYVFTQEFSRRKVSLAAGLEEIFATTREAGFHGIELMSQMFTPELRDRTIEFARKHGIDVPITYCGGRMHDPEDAAKAISNALSLAEVAAPAGTVAIDMNPDPIGRAKTDGELAIQSENLNRLGAALAKRKQRLFVHHHTPEMAGNAREWRHILMHTDPALVWLTVDTHWAFRGGQDWMAVVREAGKRVGSFHLRNSVDGVWSESFGEGELDYTKLAAYLRETKLRPYLEVELAYEAKTPHTRSLMENLRLGREYAERVFDVRA